MKTLFKTARTTIFLLACIWYKSNCDSLQGDYLQFQCPQDWIQDGSFCYKYFNVKASYQSAREICYRNGAFLVNVSDATENQLVGEVVANSTNGNGEGQIYWIDRRWWPYAAYSGFQEDMSEGYNCTVITINKTELYKYSMRKSNCAKEYGFACKMNACLTGLYLCANGRCIKNSVCDSVDDCGDYSDERNCSAQCTSVQQGTSGIINGGNKDCIWTIEGPSDSRITLTFASLSLAQGEGYVEAWVGGRTLSTSTPVKRFYLTLGDDRTVRSSNNFMIVVYSSYGISSNSFSAQWMAASSVAGDPTDLVATYDVQMINYSSPINASYETTKIWIIRLGGMNNAETILTVTVNNFALDASDSISFYDGESTGGSLLYTLSSLNATSAVYPLMSVSMVMRVVLRKSSSSLRNSISFSFNAGCRSVLSAARGIIRSPGYPFVSYPSNINCSWLIASKNNDRLTLSVDDIFLNNIYSISTDKLAVFIGSDTTAPKYETISNRNVFNSENGTFLLLFNSSALFNGRGFQATFSTDCPTLTFSNSTMANGPLNTTLGSTISLSCPTGYYFAQEEFVQNRLVILVCALIGWKTSDGTLINRTPKCFRRYCGQPDSIQNGYIVNATGVQYRDNVTYSCYPDFKMTGSESATCQESGYWSSRPNCVGCECPPVSILNGNFTYESLNRSECGAVVNFTCDPGYLLNGSITVVCRNYSWSPPLPKCDKVWCVVPTTIPHGSIQPPARSIEFQASVELRCDDGYSIDNATRSVLSCTSNQTLNVSDPKCQDIDECVAKPFICGSNSTCRNTAGGYSCACEVGFNSSNGANCTDIDECSSNRHHCFDFCNNTIGSYSCSCRRSLVLYTRNGTSGYYLPQSEDGLSPLYEYYINHTCVPHSCWPTPSLSNGFINTTQAIFHSGDSAIFVCNFGYSLNGSAYSNCTSDGNWSAPFPSCEVATCAVPSNFSLSGLIAPPTFSTSAPVPYGQSVSFVCMRFRAIPLNLSRTCVYDLRTDSYRLGLNPNWECSVVDCGAQPLIPGAQFTASVNWVQNGSGWYSVLNTYYNASFSVSCPPSYTMLGSTGNRDSNVVVCGSDGRWKTGNISCDGPACTDPGTPPGAKQIVPFSYESNYLVSFNCNKNGFTPSYPYPLKCIPGINPSWNGSLPSCIDSTPPIWTNCPSNTIRIDKYEAANFTLPVASDNSGLVQMVAVVAYSNSSAVRKYFDPKIALSESCKVNYTAYDSMNNSGVCSIEIIVKDNRPPFINCSTKYLSAPDIGVLEYTFQQSDVLVRNYPSAASSAVSVSYDPPVVVASIINIGRSFLITATAKNSDGNVASCRFTVVIRANPCSANSLSRPINATVSCNPPSNTSNSCNVTCVAGRFFYNSTLDPSGGQTKIYTCSAGLWSPSGVVADCLEPTSARFTPTYSLVFGIQQSGDRSCYATAVQGWLGNAAQALQNSFQTLLDPSVLVSLVTPVQESNISVDTLQQRIKVNVSFDISSSNMSVSRLNSYGVWVTSRINGTTAQASGCLLTFQQTESLVSRNFVCLPYNLQQQTYGDFKYCFPCPRGSYFNSSTGCAPCDIGTYQDQPGLGRCKLCPNDTSTARTGSISQDDCQKLCSRLSPGLYNPTTKIVPCFDCPVDTYAVNDTCVACPLFTHTRGTGKSSADDCQSECLPGQYSDWGVEPCMSCPQHFFSSTNRSTYCLECDSYKATAHRGSTECFNETVICNVTEPCKNNGTCVAVNHQIQCRCLPGFTGVHCETQIRYCASNPCYYNGSCVDQLNSYYCECPQGSCYGTYSRLLNSSYASEHIERVASNEADCKEKCITDRNCYGVDWNPVSSICWFTTVANPTIISSDNVTHWLLKRDPYNCTSGRHCEVDFSSCDSSSCQNSGFCRRVPPLPTNKPECICKLGFNGPQCENIATNLCDRVNCGHGFCSPVNSVRYQCNCVAGYTGTDCSIDINECASNPCLFGGTCVDGVNGYTCNCSSGVTGTQCQSRSNPCDGNPCGQTGVCVDDYSHSGYFCLCNEGYMARPSRDSSEACSVSFTLLPGVGSERGTLVPDVRTPSACQEFCRNLTSCVAVDFDTEYNNCYDHTDLDSLVMSRYSKPYIYQYVINRCPAQGTEKMCIKRDFCTEEPCANGGTCTWSASGSACLCPPGYYGSLCEKNIDECASKPCRNNGACVDGINGYTCQCAAGYNGTGCEMAANACSSIPCSISGSSRCGNLVTDYVCYCRPGYNGVNCSVEVDECLSSPCLHGGICRNAINSYSCNCSTGWEGLRCEKVTDYCSPNRCLNGGTCYTTLADYYCVCPRGSFGRNCETNYLSCNITRPCITNGSVCTESQELGPVCSCPPEYTGRGCELGKNFCNGQDGVCQNGAECVSKLDDYECHCVQKYSGWNCDAIADSCPDSSCSAGTCIRSYTGHSCQCGLNFTTPSCQKELNSDFDLLFIDPSGRSYAVQSYAFALGSSQITCAFFIRYDQSGASGRYFTLYGQQDQPVGSPLYPLIEVNDRAVTFYVQNGSFSQRLEMSTDVVVNDTNWHQAAVLWNCLTGWTELWIDSRRSAYFNFTQSIGYTLPPYGFVVLGARLATISGQYTLLRPGRGNGFEGYISQVNIWSRVLVTSTEIPQLLNWKDVIYNGLVARWGNYEWKGLILRSQPSSVGVRSPSAVVKGVPEFDFCPGDLVISSSEERGAKYALPREPQPKPKPGRKFTIKSTYKIGQTLAFGRYVNTYAIFDDAGNAATCSFNIYIQNMEEHCLAPKYSSAGFYATCMVFGYFRSCPQQCPADRLQAVDYPGRYTCGPEGSFNPSKPNTRLGLPSCSRYVKAKGRLYIRFIYRKLPNCEDQHRNVEINLRNAFNALSRRWRGLCNGECESVTNVNSTCAGGSTIGRKRRSLTDDMDVLVTIDNVDSMLNSTEFISLSLPAIDVVNADIYDNKSINFDYQGNIIPGTIPDPSTINVTFAFVCNTTTPLQGDECVACTEGSFYDSTVNKCALCPVGQYQNLAEQTSCVPCPGGNTTESEGSRSLADCVKSCPAGSYYEQAVQDCQLCPYSFYQDNFGQFRCKPCLPTKESFVNGSTSDINCTDICDEGSQLMDGECVNCSIGTYRDSSFDYCKQCPTGLTTAGDGAVRLSNCSIPLCLEGQYLNKTNGSCVPCARGTYKSFTSQLNASDATCSQCPNNKTTYASGATNISQCVLTCTYGYEDHNGSCSPCPIGYFKDNANTTLCTLCPNNNLTNGTGAVSADNCTVANCTSGFRLSWNGTVSECVECDYGQYQDEWWQMDCKPCPLDASGQNTTSLQKGLTNSSQCTPNCESGREYSLSSRECVPCSRGFYREKYKNPVCKVCGPANTTADVGAISADNCTVANCSSGTFLTKNNTCESCPAGKYQDKKWQTTCLSCPAGSTSKVGSASLSNCTNPCTLDPCGDTKDCSVNLTAAPYFYQCTCKIGYEADDNGTCTNTQLSSVYGGIIGGVLGAVAAILLAIGIIYALRRKPAPSPAPRPVVPEAVVENSPVIPESRALYRAPMYDQSNLQTSYVLKLPSVVSDRGSLIRLNNNYAYL